MRSLEGYRNQPSKPRLDTSRSYDACGPDHHSQDWSESKDKDEVFGRLVGMEHLRWLKNRALKWLKFGKDDPKPAVPNILLGGY